MKLNPSGNAKLVSMGKSLQEEMEALLGPDGVLLYPSHPTTAPRHHSPMCMPFNFAYTGEALAPQRGAGRAQPCSCPLRQCQLGGVHPENCHPWQWGVSLLWNIGQGSRSCFKTVLFVPAVCSGAGLVSGAGVWQVPESHCHLLGCSLGLFVALPRLELLDVSTTLQSCLALEARRDGAWGASLPEQSLALWRDA